MIVCQVPETTISRSLCEGERGYVCVYNVCARETHEDRLLKTLRHPSWDRRFSFREETFGRAFHHRHREEEENGGLKGEKDGKTKGGGEEEKKQVEWIQEFEETRLGVTTVEKWTR